MSRYHTVSAALDKEAGLKDIADQLSGLLGAAGDAWTAVKKLGAETARKVLDAIRSLPSSVGRGTRSRFAKAIMSIALASGAMAATGCASATVNVGARVSYDEYRSRPQVVRVIRAGFPERDVKRIYVRVRVNPPRSHGRPDRGPSRGRDQGFWVSR